MVQLSFDILPCGHIVTRLLFGHRHQGHYLGVDCDCVICIMLLIDCMPSMVKELMFSSMVGVQSESDSDCSGTAGAIEVDWAEG